MLLLVPLCPQAVTVLVRDCRGHEVTEEELKVLLTFVEEDVQDYRRQSTAFPLLKVRRDAQSLVESELHLTNQFCDDITCNKVVSFC